MSKTDRKVKIQVTLYLFYTSAFVLIIWLQRAFYNVKAATNPLITKQIVAFGKEMFIYCVSLK